MSRSEVTWGAGLRWSFTELAWCGIVASMTDGHLLLRRELTWYGTSVEEAAKEIHAATVERYGDAFTFMAGNPEIFPGSDPDGESIAETFQHAGIPLLKGTSDRRNGFARVRALLSPRRWPDGSLSPTLIVHPDCHEFIGAIPTLVKHATRPDEIEETPDEYPVTGLMYYAMKRPMPRVAIEPPLPPNAVGHLVEELRRSLRDGGAVIDV